MSSNLTLSARLLRRKKIDPASGCWEWIGAKSVGYGRIRVGSKSDGSGKIALAHRCAYEVFVGDIPHGLDVCHHCDNRSCINPQHLFVGTRRDNMQDCLKKGRLIPPPIGYGEDHAQAKLTLEQVQAIRASTGSSNTVGAQYGITGRHVRHLREGKWWKKYGPGTGVQPSLARKAG